MSLALSAVALLLTGQFGTVNVTIADQSTYSFNDTQCASTVLASFTTVLTSTNICGPLQLFVTDATSCPNDPVSGDYELTEVPQATLLLNKNQNDTRTIEIAKLPYFVKNLADGGTQCGAKGLDITHLLCASVMTSLDFQCFNKSALKAAKPVSIRYDTKPPGVPKIVSAEGLDSSASVTVSVDADTATVTLEYRVLPGGDWTFGATVASGKSTQVIDGLENGKEYELRAKANDAAGNTSEPSEAAKVTPIRSAGFWSACVDAGCPPQGCSAAAAAPLLLAALALAMLRRRPHR